MSRTRAPLGNGRMIEPAGLERRLKARLLDVVLLSPAMMLFAGSFVVQGLAEFADALAGPTDAGQAVPGYVYLWMWGGLLVLLLYEPVMVARWGATVGKRAMGIRVVRLADGGAVTVGRSCARIILPTAAGALTFGAGWLVVWLMLACSMASRRERRGWHDRLAGTVVVRAPAERGSQEFAADGRRTARDAAALPGRARMRVRAAAGLIDVASAIPLAVLSMWLVLDAVQDYGIHYLDSRYQGHRSYAAILAWSSWQWTPPVLSLTTAMVIFGPVVAGCWGATAGQRLTGIRVLRADGGGPVGLGRALLRWSLCAVPLGAGAVALLWAPWLSDEEKPATWGSVLVFAAVCWAVWALVHASVLWDPQRRGWRDKLTGTTVVTAASAGPGAGGLFQTGARTGDAMDERWQRFMSHSTRLDSASSSDSAAPPSAAEVLACASQDGSGR